MVIESLVLPSFCEVIKTYFSHYEFLGNFPGNIYFVIIIYTWNTYSAIRI